MIKDSKVYDTLKYIAQIVLPGLGALYFGLADLWNLPEANRVVGTITIVDTFLGLLLKRSSDKYNASDEKFDGSIDVQETEEKKTFSLDLKDDPENLDKKDEVLFKVKKENNVDAELVPKKKAPRKKATKSTK